MENNMRKFEDKLTSIRLELQLIRNATEQHSAQSQDAHHTLQTSLGLLGNGIVQDRQEDNTTIVPRGYYPIKTNKLKNLPTNPCVEIERRSKTDVNPSGYYWVQNAAGASVHVYCNMNRSCCGYTGGWVRVGYLNMTNSSHKCPSGLTLHDTPRRCGITSSYDGCISVTYPSHGIQYQRVCGRITAYQKGTTDAFYNHYSANSALTTHYVDGVSITHGSSYSHIWTFAAANDELRADQWRCPCSRIGQNFTGYVPSYVGDDYFCDAGTSNFPDLAKAYTTNPIWDGSGCGSTSSCCAFNSPPWFCKELTRPTTDYIIVRVCRDQYSTNEDVQIELIELYIG